MVLQEKKDITYIDNSSLKSLLLRDPEILLKETSLPIMSRTYIKSLHMICLELIEMELMILEECKRWMKTETKTETISFKYRWVVSYVDSIQVSYIIYAADIRSACDIWESNVLKDFLLHSYWIYSLSPNGYHNLGGHMWRYDNSFWAPHWHTINVSLRILELSLVYSLPPRLSF